MAYVHLRAASFGGGDAALDHAVRWADEAERAAARPDAFVTPDGPLSKRQVGSLYYDRPGVLWTRALVAHAVGDAAAWRRAVAAFLEDVRVRDDAPVDLHWGAAGWLIACAQLLELAPGDNEVRVTGDRLAEVLARLPDHALAPLGPAHGWAGIALAQLRWARARGVPPGPGTLALLDRLAAYRRPSGRWPFEPGSKTVYRGWCHGSAGWAVLWTQAWSATRDDRFLELAGFCAADAVSASDDGQSLCCGRVGEAYAALALFRATGESRWLRAAEEIARAAGDIPNDEPPHRLFSGARGLHLLRLELEDPARSAFPVAEPLLWD